MKDQRLLQMQVFRAVVEYDGFTAAAYALESSQPFVSRTIAQLERRLGAKLTNVEDVLNPKTLKPAGLHVTRSRDHHCRKWRLLD